MFAYMRLLMICCMYARVKDMTRSLTRAFIDQPITYFFSHITAVSSISPFAATFSTLLKGLVYMYFVESIIVY